jgi:hypothetical protein
MKRVISVGLFLIALFNGSCVHEPLIIPEIPDNRIPGCTPSTTVCFESSVLPIFISSCAKPGCHDAASHKEGFVLDSYNNIIKRGIKKGNANDSEIYEVLFETGDDAMPPDAPLTQAQKDSIKVWINQGALNTVECNCFCDENQFTYALTIKPMVDSKCVGCHKPGSLGGNIDLSTYAATKIQVTNGKFLGSITHSVGYTPMPQGGKLSDCEITQITNWINAGALEN